jgi:two-component system sensor histidine kinase RstB
LWISLAVCFLSGIGLSIQLRYLRKKIIDPVNSLVMVASNGLPINASWPNEVQEIGEELRSSFEAKEQAVFSLLVRGVIHDIKTFLHSLLIATEVIGEASDPEKRLRRLENLYAASKINLPKMKRIIELTLDGGRTIEVSRTSHKLLDTVAEAIAANSSYARECNVSIAYAEIHPVEAVHDPVQLERAMSNLIRNGIEAAASGDLGQPKCREVQVSVQKLDNDTVEVNIDDSGSGYDGYPSKFMPTASKKAHGAGLGLYITQKIVHGHDGQLVVNKSKVLGGARFSVQIPTGDILC